VLNDVSDFRMRSSRGFNDISIDGAVSHLRSDRWGMVPLVPPVPTDPLTEVAREGARRMLAQGADIAEADAFVARGKT